MTVAVELEVPSESFVLARAMREHPATVVELEPRVVGDGATTSFLWAEGGDTTGFLAAIEDDPTVAAVVPVDRRAGCHLCRVRWRDLEGTVVDWPPDGGRSVLRAVGRGEEWSLAVRFPDRDRVADFRARREEPEPELRARRVYEPSRPKIEQYGLTAAQRDAIVAALRMGYFAVPRRCELRDVGAALGLSANAVSERIRRGEASLFGAALAVDDPARASGRG